MIALAVVLLLAEPAGRRATCLRIHRLGFACDPLPSAKQGLVAYIDPLVWGKRWRGRERGEQERTIRGAEPVEYCAQVGFTNPCFGKQSVETNRAADSSAFSVDFRQGPERLLDRQFLSGAFVENLVGVARQRFRHAPDGVIRLSSETPDASGWGFCTRPVPQPH